MKNEPNAIVTIELDLNAKELFERGIKQLMEYRNEERNEVAAFALFVGLIQLQNAMLEKNTREPLIMAAIEKLKLGKAVSNEELEVISHAARSGHLEARIIVDDFKRFGRSMARS